MLVAKSLGRRTIFFDYYLSVIVPRTACLCVVRTVHCRSACVLVVDVEIETISTDKQGARVVAVVVVPPTTCGGVPSTVVVVGKPCVNHMLRLCV